MSLRQDHIQEDSANLLLSLPSEIQAEIISHLPVSSVIRLARASKQFMELIESDDAKLLKSQYWQTQLQAYFLPVAGAVKSDYARAFIQNYIKAIKEIKLTDLLHHPAFRKDREIVLAAVKQNGLALRFADESLKKDRGIVLAAVKQNGRAFWHADESLQKDRDIVLAAVKQDGEALWSADESLKKDRDIVLAAVKQDGEALRFADASLKKDRGIVLAAVKQDGRALVYADKSLQKDRDIVLAAVKQDGWALDYADASLRNDKEFIEITNICNEIFTKKTEEERAEVCEKYLQSSRYLNDIKQLFLQDIESKLQNPKVTRAEILDLFDKIKNPDGPYKILHQQRNPMWDTLRLRLFQFNSNPNDAKPFWHTASYQKAVKLLKEAYVSRRENQTDHDRQDKAKDLIDYTRRNFFGAAEETETRRKLNAGV